MKNTITLLGTIFTMILLINSPAFALDPMGPPKANLGTGEYRLGLDFAGTKMDIEESALGLSATLEDVKSKRLTANLGYGLSKEWEIFARLGVTDVEVEDDYSGTFDSGAELAYGFGTKVTVIDGEQLSWGALFQMGWSKAKDNVTFNLSDFGLGTASTDIEADWYEMQIAFGPTYKCTENWILYGGPFLHFVDGDIDYKAVGISADVEEKSQFGGYLGTQIDLSENTSWFIEYQLTSDAQAIGTGISWRF